MLCAAKRGGAALSDVVRPSIRGESREGARCRFTTYRHRFARAAPAPRANRNDAKIQRIVDVRRPSRCARRTSASPNHVLTHAARAAAFQAPLVAARGAREGLWLEQYKRGVV